MRRSLLALLTLALGLAHSALAQVPSSATQAAQKIIQEHGLWAGEETMRKHPRWAPGKVVVALPRGFSNSLPDYEQQLADAAGSVELVFDRSGGWDMDPALLEGADGVIGFCTRDVLANADDLVWLHSYTVGVDRCSGLPSELLDGRVFSNSKRLSGPTIAEHTIAMLMSLARGLPAYHSAQMENRWDRGIAGDDRFGELSGKTLLVVGLGGIGTEVARRAHGLGMRVTATRNSSREGPDFVDYVGLSDELGKLASEANVIVNALPLTDETRGLFDKDFFDGARKGAIFLSVGRGGSTVTDDLVAALESGQVYGAGLDVTDPEPLPEDHPLWQMERVIITPHISASGGDASRRAAIIAIENLRRYVAGDALLSPVDMEKGY